MFNTKQQLTANKLLEFINQNTHKIFYLIGFAGSGKTYTISKITKKFLVDELIENIYYCAPTHKALKVLESYIKSNINASDKDLSNKIKFMTIHKLLEFKPIIQTETGSKVFKSTKESKFLKNISKNLVVIDECSMISQEMVDELNKYINLYPIKIIYMGDPKQLPPVGEVESLIFSTIPNNYQYHIVLDEIMRTNSVDIKAVCSVIRNWNLNDQINQKLIDVFNNSTTRRFRMYHIRNDYNKSSWFKSFIKEIQNNEVPIILTWKNSTSDYYNNIIRKFIHKSEEIDNYMINDYLMFNNYYASPENNESFFTSDMVKIIHTTTVTKILYNWSEQLISKPKTDLDRNYNSLIRKISKLDNEFKINILQVKRIQSDVVSSNNTDVHIIHVITFSDLNRYREMLKNIKEQIESFYKRFRIDTIVSKLWDIYHTKLIEPYAEINFGYSITSHKSQGSTYRSVYVDVKDICSNSNKTEMQKSLYTSAGRASERLGFMIE
ncbi:putative DNA helicase [Acanthamoeba castellanii mimivirus]|uniref:Uncharacterized protein R530 n=5 Tax=Mimivirus TaxID=315393 RepID=YR530_MIMIV|nr:putative DNA helicase [Acanthamoeba polyphaga mimivirus]Q5UQ92.1 RecName: Full=Uncharacterized protein R530 [Acanthamoeba polyphaga mimivirus]AEQ60724.1 putative Pif1 helicase [Acanthamoeba castellanii mamavirus]AHA45322.1 putative DNA helicase [Hirudovirus strain Sangsue]AHJ40194.2 DNA helicase [Samba virus]ALR84119.1 putative Pif1 helicase [Niemeyer virus]AMZ02974.1 putative DNA helicase [Mimivirus Bombay]EJN40961.1 putative DNA helicase [Acanthamoeba polyphaga lentillevirus]QTF49451.1